MDVVGLHLFFFEMKPFLFDVFSGKDKNKRSDACSGGGMVYAEDLKSLTRKGLWVRLPPRAQKVIHCSSFFILL